MTQPNYFRLDLELMVLHTTLNLKLFCIYVLREKNIDSHFRGCNESLFSISQLFIELHSMANFVSITLGSLSETMIMLSSAY